MNLRIESMTISRNVDDKTKRNFQLVYYRDGIKDTEYETGQKPVNVIFCIQSWSVPICVKCGSPLPPDALDWPESECYCGVCRDTQEKETGRRLAQVEAESRRWDGFRDAYGGEADHSGM